MADTNSSFKSNSAIKRDLANVLHPYTNLVTHATRGATIMEQGQGIYVKDSQGKEYIEAMAGLWCTSLGYQEERLIAAAMKQFRQLPYGHLFAHKSNNPAIDLASRLIEMAPPPLNSANSKVFFANSGSEAIDSAIKIVWYYHNAIGKSKKKMILSRQHAYHGVTVAGASLTGLPILHKSFDLPIISVKHLTVPHYPRMSKTNESEEAFTERLIQELEQTISEIGADNIGAMFAEPLQGAGGVIIPPKNYFQKLQPILKKHQILLVADEVITGFCRTGRMWGSETFGLEPDMLTTAKALSSAYLPISAVLVRESIANEVIKEAGKQGSFGTGFTYSGHPVAAAVALETLNIYQERDMLGHVAKLSGLVQQHLAQLRQHPLVGNARGIGLIGAVELWRDKKTRQFFDQNLTVAAKVATLGEKHGVILRPLAFDSVAFCPPLIINEQELIEMFRRMKLALDEATPLLLA